MQYYIIYFIEEQGRLLSPSMLKLLGEINSKAKEFGEPIKEELMEIWDDVMKNGLKENLSEEIIGKYPPPENFNLALPLKIKPD